MGLSTFPLFPSPFGEAGGGEEECASEGLLVPSAPSVAEDVKQETNEGRVLFEAVGVCGGRL